MWAHSHPQIALICGGFSRTGHAIAGVNVHDIRYIHFHNNKFTE